MEKLASGREPLEILEAESEKLGYGGAINPEFLAHLGERISVGLYEGTEIRPAYHLTMAGFRKLFEPVGGW